DQDGLGVHVPVENGRLDLADEGGVAEELAVRAEDGRLVFADLLLDAGFNSIELLSDRGTSIIEARDFQGKSGDVQLIGLATGKDFVHAESARYDDSRRHWYAFSHVCTLPVLRKRVNSGSRDD